MSNVNPSPIETIYLKMCKYIDEHPGSEKKLQNAIESTLRKLFIDSISQSAGYCHTFKLNDKEVTDLYKLAGLDSIDEIKEAFMSEWETPPHAHMVNNAFYHILLLFCIYGIRRKNVSIKEKSLSILLSKIWNGRKTRAIPYCNQDTMRYVIANLSGKYVARKYDTPISMLMQHFTPSLLLKYEPWIEKDTHSTKRLFDQCWCRIEQLFYQSFAISLKTGKNEARSGLAPAYYKARDKGFKISKPSALGSDDVDSGSSSMDYYSSNEFDDLISGVVNYITMNINPTYDPAFIKFVNLQSTVGIQGVEIILKSMHSVRYTDYIRDIIELMFKQLQIETKSEICQKNFINEIIKRRFISSKHSENITQLKKIIDSLLEKIFDNDVKYTKYSAYSGPRQGHIRKLIFYGFGYNIQKFVCSMSGN